MNILNKLNLLVMSKDISREDVSEELSNIIKDMVDYVAYHFSTEEAIMKAIDYSGFKSHVVKHRNFTNKVLEEVNNYKNGKQIDIKGLIVFLRDWLFNHIVVEDKVFINEVKSTLEKMAREEYNR